MTVSAADLALYAAAQFALFLTPGPVWVALLARTMSGGFSAAWPLAVGVVIGDLLWPVLAILGVSWVVSVYGEVMTVLRWVASATFIVMGILIIRNAGRAIGSNSRLTRPGRWAGFLAGLAVILGNPKAILFYMGVLPGFFDLTRLTWVDVAAICGISAAIPLSGNLALAWFLGRARALLRSPAAVRRTNRIAGGLLIALGCAIPLL
ncbi:Threonine/homoserine/homoserine lactone efflux protein [Loktanella fryxellensis]|uniref:Threonine/homoserine/homoserine lactone efflux protein n=1 Tax=Loktanella fryxellensis TaxID=245187 RepID=A0A1H7ZSM4_9RHOB|nr:LysE family translocator [Loktanella fryxellensis]SEM61266.1 Threonine/homoserine/homoserine lactone efflux protein [Loktanella fryxellensis]